MMVLDASVDVKHKFTLLKLSNHSFVLFIPVYARYHQQYFIQLSSYTNWSDQLSVVNHSHGSCEYGSNTLRPSQGVFEPCSPLTSQGKAVLQAKL